MEISKGEYQLPHFATNSDCDCGFVFVGEGMKCVANFFYHNTDKDKFNDSGAPELIEAIDNVKLYIDAAMTFQKCGMLPSEILEIINKQK